MIVTAAKNSLSKRWTHKMDTRKSCQNCGAPVAADAPRGGCPACLMKVAMGTGTDADGESPGFVPPTVEALAAKFPQLEIIGFIGRGGMGAVYKARQKVLDRVVALKILPPDTSQDPAFAERFTREARALARLNHPGIVTIHEFGRADGLYFFLMEYVDGLNLRDLLAASRISPHEALAIVPQICEALQFAHDQGIVHRDIKPENILLDRRGRVKVADFGLAKLVAAETGPEGESAITSAPADLTRAGKIMGTPNYMAPEQKAQPEAVDHRADIYALGVVFYQMLTGELPDQKIAPPSAKVQIDVRLDAIVLRALQQQPELRYQQVSEVRTLVETLGAMNPGPLAPPAPSPPFTQTMNTTSSQSFRRRAVIFIGVAACAVITGLAVRLLLEKQITLGPSNPGAEQDSDAWWVGTSGKGYLFVDHTDPASGNSDFTLGNTNLEGNNSVAWRSVAFPLGPAAAGAKPITFSFSYKLVDEVDPGDNVLVQVRFFDQATNWISDRDFPVGAITHDSFMSHYKTVTVGDIRAPQRAQMADVHINTDWKGFHWSSGNARFDNIFVTTVPYSLRFKAVVITVALASLGSLILLLVRFWRRSVPASAAASISRNDSVKQI